MLKESLQFLKEKKYDQEFDNFLDNLIKFDDRELYLFLKEGVRLSDNIILEYHDAYGFKCYNLDRFMIGNLPLCALMEKRINQFLVKFIQDNHQPTNLFS